MTGRVAALARKWSKARGYRHTLTVQLWEGPQRTFSDVKRLRYVKNGGGDLGPMLEITYSRGTIRLRAADVRSMWETTMQPDKWKGRTPEGIG